MGYFFLLVTIILESAAVVFMKLSAGFHSRVWSLLAVLAYILSFIFFTLSLKHLQAGIANAIWAGSSTLLVAMLGIIIFKEQLNGLQFVFLSLIVIGIIGLSIGSTASLHHHP